MRAPLPPPVSTGSRSVVPPAPAAARSHRRAARRPRRSRPWPGAVAALLAAVLVLGLAASAWVLRDRWSPEDAQADREAPEVTSSDCAATTGVRVAVAPELATVLADLLAAPVRYGADCAEVTVESVDPLLVSANLQALDAAALPRIWVPDSSTWTARTTTVVPVQAVGSLASSPLVLAAGDATLAALGWQQVAPSWSQALLSGHALALQDLGTTAEGLLPLAAMRGALGADGDAAVAQVALAASRTPVPSPARALQVTTPTDPAAPFVAVTEQQVLAASDPVQGVYPADGSPWLDYPLVVVGDAGGPDAAAVQAVLGALRSPGAAEALAAAGFRGPDGTVGPGMPAAADGAPVPAAVTAVTPDPVQVGALLSRLATLALPSRLLTVVDVSTSMEADAGGGRSRVELARDALRSALGVLPDTASGGVWLFADELTADTDWEVVSPTAAMTADDGGAPHRQRVDELFSALPQRLSSGGTALYDTTLAAVRAHREGYDPAAVNTVVLLTDGRDEDSDGVDLDDLVSTLEAEADPARPVQVVTVGVGPDVDADALERISAATGGGSYLADDPADLQQVLFAALARRA